MMPRVLRFVALLQGDLDDGDGGVLDGAARSGGLVFKSVAIGLTVIFTVVLALLALSLGTANWLRRRRAERRTD